MTGADAYVAVLKEWRVRHLFGLPGTTEAPLLHALHQQDAVRYVLALSEGIAVGMADGYARAGGRPGVASLHTTVGVLGGLSILYNAWRDATPVVVTAAHKHTRVLGRRGFTTTPDLPALVAPLAKWSWQSLNADQVGEDLDRALRTALSSPTGPVFLATPEDLLTAAVPDLAVAGWSSPPVTRVRPEAGAVARAVRLLLAAELPLLVLGSDVAVSGAVEAAIALAEALAMPVLWESFNALSAVPFPSDHPQFLGLFTPQAPVLAEADTVCAIGPRLFTQCAPPARPELPPGVPVIHTHRSSDEVGWIYPAAVGMQADAASVLADLLAAVQAAGGLPAQQRERRQAAIGRLQAGRSSRWCPWSATAACSSPFRVSGPPPATARRWWWWC